MNDYVSGTLGRERQSDFMRETTHDELVAQVHRPSADPFESTADHAALARSAQHGWRRTLRRLVPPRLVSRGDRP